jgi:hypothetical protein
VTPTGRYQLVPARFWQMREVKGLSDDARTALLYLWTSPHANMLWFYHCPLAYVLEDLAWTRKARLGAALDELATSRLAYYDYESQVVFVALALADRPPAGSKQVEGAAIAARAVVASFLHGTLVEVASRACPDLAEALRYPRDTLSIGYLSPQHTPPIGSHTDSDSNTVSNTDSDSERDSPSPALTAQRILALWNEVCPPALLGALGLSDDRRKRIRTRLTEDPARDEAWWRDYFGRIRSSPHCRGENDRGWRATFDFAIKSEEVVLRVLEGKYDKGGVNHDRASGIGGSSRPPGYYDRLAEQDRGGGGPDRGAGGGGIVDLQPGGPG